MDKPLIIFVGQPPHELEIHIGCHYYYQDQKCKILEIKENNGRKEKAIITLNNNKYEVKLTDLSPIFLNDDIINKYLKHYYPQNKFYEGAGQWEVEDTIPFNIDKDVELGDLFWYTNPIIKKELTPPFPISILSELEATHRGFNIDENALYKWQCIKSGKL